MDPPHLDLAVLHRSGLAKMHALNRDEDAHDQTLERDRDAHSHPRHPPRGDVIDRPHLSILIEISLCTCPPPKRFGFTRAPPLPEQMRLPIHTRLSEMAIYSPMLLKGDRIAHPHQLERGVIVNIYI